MKIYIINVQDIAEQLIMYLGKTEEKANMIIKEILEAVENGTQSLGSNRITEDLIIADEIFAEWLKDDYKLDMAVVNLDSIVA